MCALPSIANAVTQRRREGALSFKLKPSHARTFASRLGTWCALQGIATEKTGVRLSRGCIGRRVFRPFMRNPSPADDRRDADQLHDDAMRRQHEDRSVGDEMKLYYFPGACALADHIVLEWIGAPYEAIKLDRAALKSPKFLALNPEGAVPVLVDGHFVLTQNVAILYYLAEQHPDARLLANGSARGRAEVMRWLGLLNSDVHPAFKPIFAPAHFHPDPTAAKLIADTARARVRKHLERLDRHLDGQDWLAGNRSIADPYLFVLLRWARRLEVDSSGLNRLAGFVERMEIDRGVRAALCWEEGVEQ